MKIKSAPTGTPNSTSGQVDPKRYKKIGPTTYVVTSVFSPNAKSDVVEKIARLIEREASIK